MQQVYETDAQRLMEKCFIECYKSFRTLLNGCDNMVAILYVFFGFCYWHENFIEKNDYACGASETGSRSLEKNDLFKLYSSKPSLQYAQVCVTLGQVQTC